PGPPCSALLRPRRTSAPSSNAAEFLGREHQARSRHVLLGGALADLLRFLVPLDALADARTQLPLRRLRLRVDPLPQVIEARGHDRLVVGLEVEAWNRGAGALDVERGGSPETPVARAALGEVSGVDPFGIRLRELVPVEEVQDVALVLL